MLNNKVIQNAKWIVGCQIAQSVIRMVIGMLSARYLGPSNYGLISYAASIMAFFIPVMQLGMKSTLVQEYVVSPEKEGQIAGTSLVFNIVSSMACIVLITCFAAVLSAGDRVTVIVCALYSLQLVLQAMGMLQCWFQAKYLSMYSAMAVLFACVVASAYKLYALITTKNIYWFALTHSIEYGVIGIALLVMYKSNGGQKLSFSWTMGKEMFSRSKHYIAANMMVMAFQNTDHVMLKLMIGDAENGFYTTAAVCAGAANFVYWAITDSVRPAVLESRKKSKEESENIITKLYAFIIFLAFTQSMGFTLLAKPIILLLYGHAYLFSIPVLQILTWHVAFSYMGSIRNIWILGEGKHSILWKINLGGVLANVVLNAIMIPAWGARGAALASVLTQFFTNFILGFLMPSVRPNNRLILKGLDPRTLLELVKELKR